MLPVHRRHTILPPTATKISGQDPRRKSEKIKIVEEQKETDSGDDHAGNNSLVQQVR